MGLIDYLLARRDEPCGRSVPERRVPGGVESHERTICLSYEGQASGEILSKRPHSLTKRAPRLPVVLLAAMEKPVLDEPSAVGWRIWAWVKLIKVWASLRWSDVKAIIPTELRLIEGRLTTVLRQTKTFGPTKQVKELPGCVSEKAFFANPDWLKVGFDLLKSYVCCPRDYMVPKLKSNWEG